MLAVTLRAMLVQFGAKLVEQGIELLLLLIREHSEHVGSSQGAMLGNLVGTRAAFVGQKHLGCTRILLGFATLYQPALLELAQHLTNGLRTDTQQESEVLLVDSLLQCDHGKHARLTPATTMTLSVTMSVTVAALSLVPLSIVAMPMPLGAFAFTRLGAFAMTMVVPVAVVFPMATAAFAIDVTHDHPHTNEFLQQFFIVDSHAWLLSHECIKLSIY